nr:hypothetical protein [Candidatus Woesearchaeota archaeon]
MDLNQESLLEIILKNIESAKFCNDMLNMVLIESQIITPMTMDAFFSNYRMVIVGKTLMDLYIERYQATEEMFEARQRYSDSIKNIEDSLKDCFINYSFLPKQPSK